MKTWRWICAGLFLAMCLAGQSKSVQALAMDAETIAAMENFGIPLDVFWANAYRDGAASGAETTYTLCYRDRVGGLPDFIWVHFSIFDLEDGDHAWDQIYIPTPEGGKLVLRAQDWYAWTKLDTSPTIYAAEGKIWMYRGIASRIGSEQQWWHFEEAEYYRYDAKLQAFLKTDNSIPSHSDDGAKILQTVEVAYRNPDQLTVDTDMLERWKQAKAYHATDGFRQFSKTLTESSMRRFLDGIYPLAAVLPLEGKVDERLLCALLHFGNPRGDATKLEGLQAFYPKGTERRSVTRKVVDAFLKESYDLELPEVFKATESWKPAPDRKMTFIVKGDGRDVVVYDDAQAYFIQPKGIWIQNVERFDRFSVVEVTAMFRQGFLSEGRGKALTNTVYVLAEHKDGHLYPRYVSRAPMTKETLKSSFGFDVDAANLAIKEQAKAPKAEEKAEKDGAKAETKKPASDAAASPAKEPAETEADAIRRAERKRVLTWVGVIAVVLLLVAVILWLYRRMRRLQDALGQSGKDR